jgi:hypothetical protein
MNVVGCFGNNDDTFFGLSFANDGTLFVTRGGGGAAASVIVTTTHGAVRVMMMMMMMMIEFPSIDGMFRPSLWLLLFGRRSKEEASGKRFVVL